jgi:hypothetical protein
MIYNTASVVLAGLISIVSAASVQHAPKSHNALVATEHTIQLLQKINKNDYSEACLQVWETFDKARCWCYTGCALDCSQGGDPQGDEPKKPGNQTHSEWCQDVQPWEDCRTETFDLMDNCKDADRTIQVDGAAPGVDKIAETAGYQRADVPTLIPNAIDGHLDVQLSVTAVQHPEYLSVIFPANKNTITTEEKYDIFYDGEKVVDAAAPIHITGAFTHSALEMQVVSNYFTFPKWTKREVSFPWADIEGTIRQSDGERVFNYWASDHDASDKFTIALSSP